MVDNRPGGGAQIAASAVTSSPADGYTLFAAGMGAFAINPTLYKKINYQPVRDFEGVSFLASAPMVMLASPGGRVNSAKALKEALNAGSDLSYASPGPGTAPHILGHLLSRASPKALGYSRNPMTTEQFNGFIKSELERYRPVILQAGVTVD